jgi:catechol 2,3-dioxygenase-like lactoylglutathione lyase family enzyme
MVTGLSTYRYDPLYRLVEATGREHVAQAGFGAADNWAGLAYVQHLDPGDVLAWRNYTQHYRYDPAGNLAEMAHDAGPESWTRSYTYAADSNRLLSTHVGGTDYVYASHPAHGCLEGMPHLSVMRWSFRDELQAVATQVVNAGSPETTCYVYDGDGNRVRKVVEKAAAAGADPVKKVERFYLDGVEIALEAPSGLDRGVPRKGLTITEVDGLLIRCCGSAADGRPGRRFGSRPPAEEVLINVNDLLGHQSWMRWNSESAWVRFGEQAHGALVARCARLQGSRTFLDPVPAPTDRHNRRGGLDRHRGLPSPRARLTAPHRTLSRHGGGPRQRLRAHACWTRRA